MEEPLFTGFVGIQSLASGIELYSSDLTGAVTSHHEGSVDRSYTIAFNLDDAPIETAFGETGRFHIPGGGGQVVAVSDSIRMANQIEKGTRSRSLLIRVNPESFADDDIAEEIYRNLVSTQLSDFHVCARLQSLVHQLTSPNVSGAIGKLFNESAALEVLARALMTTSDKTTLHSGSLKPRDFLGLTRVRDKIIADPLENYSLSELAHEAGMSVSALKAKFREAFGRPVFAFLSDRRLDLARDLLLKEGWPISRVAYHVGYSHQSSFALAFKRRFGVSPSRMRR